MTELHEAPELYVAGTKELVERSASLGLTWTLQLATVTDGTDPSAIVASFDGDPNQIRMTSMIGPLLAASRVWVLRIPPAGNFIVGIVTTAPLAVNCECTQVFGMSSGNTTSATFVSMPGPPTIAFTKASASTRLKLEVAGTFFSSGSSAGLAAGMDLGGPGSFDITAVSSPNPSLSNHLGYAGYLILDPVSIVGGLPAGIYTVTGVWRRNTGAGTLNTNADDVWTGCVTEVP